MSSQPGIPDFPIFEPKSIEKTVSMKDVKYRLTNAYLATIHDLEHLQQTSDKIIELCPFWISDRIQAYMPQENLLLKLVIKETEGKKEGDSLDQVPMKNPQACLLGLPAELRLKIYELVIAAGNFGLLTVNKLINREAQQQVYKEVACCIEAGPEAKHGADVPDLTPEAVTKIQNVLINVTVSEQSGHDIQYGHKWIGQLCSGRFGPSTRAWCKIAIKFPNSFARFNNASFIADLALLTNFKAVLISAETVDLHTMRPCHRPALCSFCSDRSADLTSRTYNERQTVTRLVDALSLSLKSAVTGIYIASPLLPVKVWERNAYERLVRQAEGTINPAQQELYSEVLCLAKQRRQVAWVYMRESQLYARVEFVMHVIQKIKRGVGQPKTGVGEG